MIKLKNPRKVRLIDSNGLFDLKPGETITLNSIPESIQKLVKKGLLKEVKPRQSQPLKVDAETKIEVKDRLEKNQPETTTKNLKPTTKKGK